uniref:Uncharacterized protein n=1 Tax=Molossus molossus TaxID=27622 RepID=A0A7J8I7N7_MOLMO|nr:hypothetical protein HJG59_010532 [Molossus molossus]
MKYTAARRPRFPRKCFQDPPADETGSQSSAGKGLFKARGSCLKPRLTNSCHLLGHCPRETAEPYHFRCSNSQRKKSQEK